ncbi:uncharacterized protein LOC126682575 [Mercurialis annua]|uniref:uncharacterized protein LOC126682575 n=1 Tax=Mercurialis annua TaxID=3986 RepID=UPI0024AE42B7|nr:uncharacterized protein LOC126682575 [Mercurialis annua]
MEGSSFAKELYSDSLKLSKLELDVSGGDDHDLQGGDGSFWGDSDEEFNKSSDLDREWERRRDQFYNVGYRDGLSAGKESIAQEGFNIGFKRSALVGFDWGLVRGVSSAFACLPEELKASLIETQEKRKKFQELYDTVHSISTADALKSFHDDLVTKEAAEHIENSKSCSDTTSLENKISDFNLGNYAGELQQLLLESPAIDSHLSVKFFFQDSVMLQPL